jgi:hypothetical protein
MIRRLDRLQRIYRRGKSDRWDKSGTDNEAETIHEITKIALTWVGVGSCHFVDRSLAFCRSRLNSMEAFKNVAGGEAQDDRAPVWASGW